MINQNRYSIGIVIDPVREHLRRIVAGVVDYQRSSQSIEIVGNDFRPLVAWDRLNDFDGDGLIAVVESDAELKSLRSRGVPFVLAGARILEPDLNVIASDNQLIGSAAANHLLECGLSTFVYVGAIHWADEKLRLQGFCDRLQQEGRSVTKCTLDIHDIQNADHETLRSNAVKAIRHAIDESGFPLGIFCPDAFIARIVQSICHELNYSVPDQVALLGVNDDPIICETANPPLSAIVQASRKIGYRAADQLVNLMQNQSESIQEFIPFQMLSVRKSSDICVIGDSIVESALRIIRDTAHSERLDVNSIADSLGISRRLLELRFQQALDSSPYQNIVKKRIEIARSLLVDTDLSITLIAMRSGFGSSQNFSTVFKKECGISPRQFRSNERSNPY